MGLWIGVKRFTAGLALGALALSSDGGSSAWADETARAWLGVELQNVGAHRNDSDKSGREPSGGVRVRHVVRGSPAARAGIREGDVIISMDNVPMRRPEDVVGQVGSHGPGAAVRIAVMRTGAEAPVRMNATLVRMPDNDEILRLDKVGAAAPPFNRLSPVRGTVPASLGAMRGRVVVVDFWATWCLACRMLVPRLSAWQAKFGSQGLSVIGITDDPVPEALDGASKLGIQYAVATDESYATQRAFGVRALPTVFIIDKRGIVRDVAVGFDPRREAELEALLSRLLAEPSP